MKKIFIDCSFLSYNPTRIWSPSGELLSVNKAKSERELKMPVNITI